MALAIGAMGAMQTRINAELTLIMGDPLLTAVVASTFGLLMVAIVLLSRQRSRRALRRLPGAVRRGAVPPWQLLGWITPAVFLPIVAIVVPRTGASSFAVAVVAGQVTSSLIVDRIGLGPRGRRAVTPLRVAAAVAAVGLALLSATGERSRVPLPETAVLLGLVLGAGLTAGWQQAINGRLTVSTGEPFLTAVVNLAPAWLLLLTAWGAVIAVPTGVDSLAVIPWQQPWLLLAGALGAVYLAAASVLVRYLGLLLFGLLQIAGLLLGAMVLDLVWPVPGHTLSWQIVAGVIGMLVVTASLALPTVVRLLRSRVRARGLRALGGPPG